ncbi:MAG: hypothetical protein U0163_04535 [Gemmatimonadaceae bacterium]
MSPTISDRRWHAAAIGLAVAGVVITAAMFVLPAGVFDRIYAHSSISTRPSRCSSHSCVATAAAA